MYKVYSIKIAELFLQQLHNHLWNICSEEWKISVVIKIHTSMFIYWSDYNHF